MNIQKTIMKIVDYQLSGDIHKLTCEVDSSHEQFPYTVVQDNKVVLVCGDCGYAQTYIPKFLIVE